MTPVPHSIVTSACVSTLMKSAITELFNLIRQTLPVGALASKSDLNNPVVTPTMREKYRSSLYFSGFGNLPDEITQSILGQLGRSFYGVELTCKYFNLSVREFENAERQSRRARRQECESAFRDRHKQSLIHACNYDIYSSIPEFSDANSSEIHKEFVHRLRVCKGTVCFNPRNAGKGITPELVLALSSRGEKLTTFRIENANEDYLNSVASAIRAVPANGFVSLGIRASAISAAKAAGLWQTICSHPVVSHIEFWGSKKAVPTELGDVFRLVTMLGRKNANVISFKFSYCQLDHLSSEELSTFLSVTTGIQNLTVIEKRTDKKKFNCLATAVRARNSSTDPRIKFYFSAKNLFEVIDERERSTLTQHGIHVYASKDDISDGESSGYESVVESSADISEDSAASFSGEES